MDMYNLNDTQCECTPSMATNYRTYTIYISYVSGFISRLYFHIMALKKKLTKEKKKPEVLNL